MTVRLLRRQSAPLAGLGDRVVALIELRASAAHDCLHLADRYYVVPVASDLGCRLTVPLVAGA
jgi:hypothetical protein